MTRGRRPRSPSGNPLEDLTTGFSGLLDTLGDALSEVSQRLESGQSSELRRSFDLETRNGPVRAEAGIRVKFAEPQGGGSTQPFTKKKGTQTPQSANTEPGAKTPPTPAAVVRPIDFELTEDAETWRLVADIPGVEEQDISMKREDGELVIETTGRRTFYGRSVIPGWLSLDEVQVNFRNGILELVGQKSEAGNV